VENKEYIKTIKELHDYLEYLGQYGCLIPEDSNIGELIKERTKKFFNLHKDKVNAINNLEEVIARLTKKTETMRKHLELQKRYLLHLQINREAFKNALNKLKEFNVRN